MKRRNLKHKCEWTGWLGGLCGKLYVCNTEGLWGLVDFNGREITPYKWIFATMASETLSLVENTQGKCGLIDWRGNEVLPCEWRTVRFEEFSWPVIVENDDHRWGALDLSTSEFHIPLRWKWLEYQGCKCRFLVMDDEHHWGALDNFGKTLLPCTFSSRSALKVGLKRLDEETSNGCFNSESENNNRLNLKP